ncbi:MAG: alpha/beta hydrolase [Lachnospiraceae bacterium]|nr:alpha/beta hydrolase [Lachnospiraceae bacterium]
MKNGSVRIGRTDMFYVSFGSGPRNMVILPGLSDGLATVKGKAWILSLPYRKYFRDYTIYMFSRKNDMPEGYTIENMADDQILAMKTLGIKQAALLGVSQGGMITQVMVMKYPELVTKLILAVTAPDANDTAKAAVSSWIEMVKQGDHKALMVDTAKKMYSDGYLKKYGWSFPLIAIFTKPKSYDRFLKNAYAILEFDVRDSLSKISCPTLILAGSEDHTVGNEAAYELKNGIPGSELFVYQGLGHGAFEEANDFYERVFEFCSR